MPEFFDCMRCGHVSTVSTKPPKCPKCGSGAGVVVTRADPPEGTDREPAPPPAKDPPARP